MNVRVFRKICCAEKKSKVGESGIATIFINNIIGKKNHLGKVHISK